MESPDQWQSDLLHSIVTLRKNVIALCSRQSGKTTATSLAALLKAYDGGFALTIAPSERQSMEFLSRASQHHARLNLVPTVSENMHEMRFKGGGRILALPSNEKTIRGLSSVDLLVIEEASRVADSLYGSVRPMLAVSKGQTVLISTPFGQRGFFYNCYRGDDLYWTRFSIPWHQCPRITREFIAEERRQHGSTWVDQEFNLSFNPITGAFFNMEDFEGLVDWELENVQPW